MIHSPRFKTATMLLLGLVCISVAGTAWAHVQATATPSQNRVKMFWKFPCSGPPPIVGAFDTSTVGNPPPDLTVARAAYDPGDSTNHVLMGGSCQQGYNPDTQVYVATYGCAEAGPRGTHASTAVQPMAEVGFGSAPEDMVTVHIERDVVIGPAPDLVRLTLSGGGLRTQNLDPNQTVQATLKIIVYPDQATADADASQLAGKGSAFFGTISLLGTTGALLPLNGFSVGDFLVQNDGGGQFTALPSVGLAKVALVPDANKAVITTVGDPVVEPSSLNSTTAVGTPGPTSGWWLAPASPNPARGPMRIQFSTPHDARVSLAVFDQQGRRVRQLMDERLPAGVHQAIWDGNDTDGRRVPTALYFYRLVVDGQRLSGKVFSMR